MGKKSGLSDGQKREAVSMLIRQADALPASVVSFLIRSPQQTRSSHVCRPPGCVQTAPESNITKLEKVGLRPSSRK